MTIVVCRPNRSPSQRWGPATGISVVPRKIHFGSFEKLTAGTPPPHCTLDVTLAQLLHTEDRCPQTLQKIALAPLVPAPIHQRKHRLVVKKKRFVVIEPNLHAGVNRDAIDAHKLKPMIEREACHDVLIERAVEIGVGYG